MSQFDQNYHNLLENTPENITDLFFSHHDEPSEYDDYIQDNARTVISCPNLDVIINTDADDPYIAITATTPNELANNIMLIAWQLMAHYQFDEEPTTDQIIKPLVTEPNVLFYSSDGGCYFYFETLPTFLKIVRKEVKQFGKAK